MNSDDLENFEADREYKLAQEYQDVVGMFRYAVETERRFYLANDVKVAVTGDSARPLIEVVMTDAWVWDMYRKTRFIPTVRVLSFKDVNVEELPDNDLLDTGEIFLSTNPGTQIEVAGFPVGMVPQGVKRFEAELLQSATLKVKGRGALRATAVSVPELFMRRPISFCPASAAARSWRSAARTRSAD